MNRPRVLLTLLAFLPLSVALACGSDGGIRDWDQMATESNLGGADAVALDCGDAPWDPERQGSCEPVNAENECQQCVAALCCEEQSACNASDPLTACSFGSWLYDGRSLSGGEIGCMMECITDHEARSARAAGPETLQYCSEACAASECASERVTPATQALSACLLGLGASGGSCRSACGLIDAPIEGNSIE